jgi:hypothetical protein
MPPNQKAQALAHLWLFSAGLDPTALDAEGIPLALSLANLLSGEHSRGRKEAASLYLQAHPSGEYAIKEVPTGEYDINALQALLDQARERMS